MDLVYHHFGRFGLEMHIGRGPSQSKAECVFFPPPQFFQTTQRRNTAAILIQRTYRRTLTRTYSHQLVNQSTPSPSSPADFPIGRHVVVASSHPTHANKSGTVCKLTKKFVIFTPDEAPTDTIRILPKSLTRYQPNGQQ